MHGNKFYLGEILLPVRKCAKPKFAHHRGRTWDKFDFYIDEVNISCRLDTTWSHNLYFEFNNKWHVVQFHSKIEDEWNGKGRYDLDVTQFKKVKITTTKNKTQQP